MWIATHAKTGQRNDFREYRSKIAFVFLTTQKSRNSQTVSLAEILFLYRNGMCRWPHKQREDLHLLQTGLSLSSSLLFVILTFSWYAETRKILTPFRLVLDRESGKVSGPVPEAAASSKNLSQTILCNIPLKMMIFESLSHSYFSHGITCVAVRLVANCFI